MENRSVRFQQQVPELGGRRFLAASPLRFLSRLLCAAPYLLLWGWGQPRSPVLLAPSTVREA